MQRNRRSVHPSQGKIKRPIRANLRKTEPTSLALLSHHSFDVDAVLHTSKLLRTSLSAAQEPGVGVKPLRGSPAHPARKQSPNPRRCGERRLCCVCRSNCASCVAPANVAVHKSDWHQSDGIQGTSNRSAAPGRSQRRRASSEPRGEAEFTLERKRSRLLVYIYPNTHRRTRFQFWKAMRRSPTGGGRVRFLLSAQTHWSPFSGGLNRFTAPAAKISFRPWQSCILKVRLTRVLLLIRTDDQPLRQEFKKVTRESCWRRPLLHLQPSRCCSQSNFEPKFTALCRAFVYSDILNISWHLMSRVGGGWIYPPKPLSPKLICIADKAPTSGYYSYVEEAGSNHRPRLSSG